MINEIDNVKSINRNIVVAKALITIICMFVSLIFLTTNIAKAEGPSFIGDEGEEVEVENIPIPSSDKEEEEADVPNFEDDGEEESGLGIVNNGMGLEGTTVVYMKVGATYTKWWINENDKSIKSECKISTSNTNPYISVVNNKIIAKKVGNTVVFVYRNGALIWSFAVVITADDTPSDYHLSTDKLYLKPGDKTKNWFILDSNNKKCDKSRFVIKSDNEIVAKYKDNYIVANNHVGEATITVSDGKSIVGTIHVSVKAGKDNIYTLSVEELYLTPNTRTKNWQILENGKKTDKSKFTITSTNEKVAKYSGGDYIIAGKDDGECDIIIKHNTTDVGLIKIFVNSGYSEYTLSTNNITLKKGKRTNNWQIYLNSLVQDKNNFSYESENENIANRVGKYICAGTQIGTTTIKISKKNSNTVIGTITVNVTDNANFQTDTYILKKGESITIENSNVEKLKSTSNLVSIKGKKITASSSGKTGNFGEAQVQGLDKSGNQVATYTVYCFNPKLVRIHDKKYPGNIIPLDEIVLFGEGWESYISEVQYRYSLQIVSNSTNQIHLSNDGKSVIVNDNPIINNANKVVAYVNVLYNGKSITGNNPVKIHVYKEQPSDEKIEKKQITGFVEGTVQITDFGSQLGEGYKFYVSGGKYLRVSQDKRSLTLLEKADKDGALAYIICPDTTRVEVRIYIKEKHEKTEFDYSIMPSLIVLNNDDENEKSQTFTIQKKSIDGIEWDNADINDFEFGNSPYATINGNTITAKNVSGGTQNIHVFLKESGNIVCVLKFEVNGTTEQPEAPEEEPQEEQPQPETPEDRPETPEEEPQKEPEEETQTREISLVKGLENVTLTNEVKDLIKKCINLTYDKNNLQVNPQDGTISIKGNANGKYKIEGYVSDQTTGKPAIEITVNAIVLEYHGTNADLGLDQQYGMPTTYFVNNWIEASKALGQEYELKFSSAQSKLSNKSSFYKINEDYERANTKKTGTTYIYILLTKSGTIIESHKVKLTITK